MTDKENYKDIPCFYLIYRKYYNKMEDLKNEQRNREVV